MRWILFILILGATFATFWVPDAASFQHPELARIIFFHLPCAISTPLFLFFGSYLGLRYLRSKDKQWEIRSVAANEIGYVLALLTMATGMLFSKTQWGAWWQWDPRQTSFLLVLLLYAAYFALRMSFTDEKKRADVCAAYSCISAIPAFFLIFIFPRIPYIVQISFHPSNTIITGGFDRAYSIILSTLFVLILVLCSWIYKLSVRAGLLDLRVSELYGNMETDGSGPAPTGVVRPISLSDKS
ncbi:MAG TPA: cytochrome c biogenesis protein CcsA [Fimbriimonadaceae bacterium]|jgi:heme exporter protein C